MVVRVDLNVGVIAVTLAHAHCVVLHHCIVSLPQGSPWQPVEPDPVQEFSEAVIFSCVDSIIGRRQRLQLFGLSSYDRWIMRCVLISDF